MSELLSKCFWKILWSNSRTAIAISTCTTAVPRETGRSRHYYLFHRQQWAIMRSALPSLANCCQLICYGRPTPQPLLSVFRVPTPNATQSFSPETLPDPLNYSSTLYRSSLSPHLPITFLPLSTYQLPGLASYSLLPSRLKGPDQNHLQRCCQT